MAIFTNQATLSYNNTVITSNITTGELLEVLSVTKTALSDTYIGGDTAVYVVSLANSGPTALTGLTVADDLGGYDFDGATVTPLDYVDGSLRYFVDGAVQPTPTATAGPPLTVTGLSVPAGGNALLVYEARLNQFAPAGVGDTITNTVTVSGGGLANPVSDTATITASAEPYLTISKALCPATVTENGQLTYTFVIQNAGNTDAVATDNATITDTFDPILTDLVVTYNGAVWTEGVDYTYDETTGAFATIPGRITVPAATFTQTPGGAWTVDPGTATLTVTGTV
ncbi:MAG: hypothetical protein IJB04_05440 [Oscillospiraceae bacterium]|nr:hypothetical protein [Oscillospiraceae bacterium]